MHLRILLALALTIAAVASAQTTNPPPNPRPLSLRNCIDLALSQNLELRIEHLSVAMAGDNLAGAYGAYSPNFNLNATHNYESEPGSFDPKKFNPDFPAEIATDNLGMGLSGKAPFGFSYDLNGSVSKIQANTDFTSNPQDAVNFPGGIRSTNDHDSVVGLEMRQHLLKDFWIDSDREELLVRRVDLKVSEQALRFQIMTILLAVEVSYYDLMGAREEVQVQEEALGLRRQFVKETQRRVQLGDLPPLDDAQAETQMQNTLTRLAAAREAFAKGQNHLIGLLTDDFAQWAGRELLPTDPLQAQPPTINRTDSFQAALSQRPDLIEARLEVEKNAAMVKFRRNQLFPNLDLVGGYGGLGSDYSYRSALNDAFNFGNPVFSYGMVVSFPLDNASARGSFRASKAARQIAELQLKKAEQDVLLQVADFVTSVEFSFSQVNSTQQARSYAEAALNAETKKFQNGIVTSFEVLQFQEILTAARSAEVQAKVEYSKALTQLAFAEGAIMKQDHLDLQVK